MGGCADRVCQPDALVLGRIKGNEALAVRGDGIRVIVGPVEVHALRGWAVVERNVLEPVPQLRPKRVMTSDL